MEGYSTLTHYNIGTTRCSTAHLTGHCSGVPCSRDLRTLYLPSTMADSSGPLPTAQCIFPLSRSAKTLPFSLAFSLNQLPISIIYTLRTLHLSSRKIQCVAYPATTPTKPKLGWPHCLCHLSWRTLQRDLVSQQPTHQL
jgi:hypothetical protein